MTSKTIPATVPLMFVGYFKVLSDRFNVQRFAVESTATLTIVTVAIQPLRALPAKAEKAFKRSAKYDPVTNTYTFKSTCNLGAFDTSSLDSALSFLHQCETPAAALCSAIRPATRWTDSEALEAEDIFGYANARTVGQIRSARAG